MKPHKYAELIKAWADGATIQAKSKADPYDTWDDIESHHIYWGDEDNWFRIKPESKPDVVRYASIGMYSDRTFYIHIEERSHSQIKLTFDGETMCLKNVEMIK